MDTNFNSFALGGFTTGEHNADLDHIWRDPDSVSGLSTDGASSNGVPVQAIPDTASVIVHRGPGGNEGYEVQSGGTDLTDHDLSELQQYFGSEEGLHVGGSNDAITNPVAEHVASTEKLET